MRIRTKVIIIFCLLSMIPMAILGWLAYKRSVNLLEERIGTMNSTNSLLMLGIAYNIVGQRIFRGGFYLSKLDAMQDVNDEELDNVLNEVLRKYRELDTVYIDLFVLNAQGKVVASATPRWLGKSLKKEDLFKEVMNKEIYIGEIYIDEVSQEWLYSVALPIMSISEPDKVLGAVCMNWSPAKLFKGLWFSRSGKERTENRLFVFDRNGFLILSQSPEMNFKTNMLDFELTSVRNVLDGKMGYEIEEDEQGIKSLIGYSSASNFSSFKTDSNPLFKLRWHIINYGYPVDTIRHNI